MRPEGGMFVLMDIRVTGVHFTAFTHDLLMREDFADLPCDSFGPSAAGRLLISLTAAKPRFTEAGRRIVRFAHSIAG
jgi:arginine:pyruvate transaminase